MLIREAIEDFELNQVVLGRAERYISLCMYVLGRFETFMKDKYDITHVEDVKPAHIRQLIKHWQELGREKNNTLNNNLAKIKVFYQYLAIEVLQNVRDVAEELQRRFNAFEDAVEDAVEDATEAIEKVEVYVTETREQLDNVKAELTAETDIAKAKQLNNSKKALEEDLELYLTTKRAHEEAHSKILLEKGVAVLDFATTYEKELGAFVSCLERTANLVTVEADIEAVYELENFVQRIKNTVGQTFVDFGMLDSEKRYVKYGGKSYQLRPHLPTSRTKSLAVLKEFLNSDDYKYAYYGIPMSIPGSDLYAIN